MTPARRAAGLLLALACAGCAPSAAAPPAAAPDPPPATAAPDPPAATLRLPVAPGGLLDSAPATLDALRQEQGRRPVAVEVPGARGAATVQARTTDPVGGGLDLPASATDVAWWASGAAPGTGTGAVVLAAHVSYSGRTGPFTRLRDVAVGTEVVVVSADGSRHAYAVRSTRSAPKERLDRARLFRADGPAELALVTCGGAYDPVTRSYADNVVVTAVPV